MSNLRRATYQSGFSFIKIHQKIAKTRTVFWFVNLTIGSIKKVQST